MTHATTLGRVRVRCGAGDRLAARLRVSTMLSGTSFEPAGLSSGAVLCVRRLHDPKPGFVSASALTVRPPAAWERAVNDRLGRLAARATRPADGHVPADAEAVVFASEAEMLACLAIDAANGVVRARWWWRALVPSVRPRDGVAEVWGDRETLVPAVVAHLARRGQLVPVMRTLTVAEAHAILRRITQGFALGSLARHLDAPALEESHAVAGAARGSTSRSVVAPVTSATRALVPPPWSRWVPEADAPALSPVHRGLVGVALMLERASAVARRESFAASLAEWLAVATSPRDGSRALRRHEVMQLSSVETPVPAPTGDDDTPATGEARQAAPAGREKSAAPSSEPATSMRTTAQVGTVAPYDSDRAVETDLGGLFYLVNLALALELYGDFTQPLGPSLALPLWDFVAVVGGRLLRDPRLDEPVWELLRVLAGRGDEPIGVGFVEPDWWRPPSGAAGAAEVVGDATPSEITDRRTDSNGPILLARWIDRLMPHVRFRLRQALGVADFERMLLEHRARVVVANDRLDVFLALATLPVAIRIAGLDRDPAWVPAAGRSIGFHFD